MSHALRSADTNLDNIPDLEWLLKYTINITFSGDIEARVVLNKIMYEIAQRICYKARVNIQHRT